MRPGFAANADSVSRLLDAIVASRAAAVEQLRADEREFATFLSPVQRAQLFLQLERLQRNIEAAIRRRMQQAGGAPDTEPPDRLGRGHPSAPGRLLPSGPCCPGVG